MDDWRLNGQEEYLFGVKLYKRKFESWLGWDHTHCDFCWAKISDVAENSFREGYCTDDETHWVCEECYNDFKDKFGWKL